VQGQSLTDIAGQTIGHLFKGQAVKMGPIGYLEKSVRIYHYIPGKNPQNSSDFGSFNPKKSQTFTNPPPPQTKPPLQRVPGLFPGVKVVGCEVTSVHLRLAPWLRTSGDTTLFQCVPSWHGYGKLRLYTQHFVTLPLDLMLGLIDYFNIEL